jgi:hypothetical protein
MLLFACFCFADFRWMTDAAVDPQLFHQFQEPRRQSRTNMVESLSAGDWTEFLYQGE